MKKLFILSVLLIGTFTMVYPATGGAASRNAAGDFDFYVLALTWSPNFCAGRGGSDSEQCGPGKNPGFVLHGLWPQHQKRFSENCSSVLFPSQLKREFPGLFPNDRLYTHEWRRHGTCSGLSPREFLPWRKNLKIPPPFRRVTVISVNRSGRPLRPSIRNSRPPTPATRIMVWPSSVPDRDAS